MVGKDFERASVGTGDDPVGPEQAKPIRISEFQLRMMAVDIANTFATETQNLKLFGGYNYQKEQSFRYKDIYAPVYRARKYPEYEGKQLLYRFSLHIQDIF